MSTSGKRTCLGAGKPLRRMLEGGHLHSMILWGPPGTGKTTLARLVAQTCDAEFIAFSAVMAGVKDIRAAAERAAEVRKESGRRTVLFLDEVHRFNKAQQDAFLPWVEDGTLVFIGATTENPSFELNNALLSRARVYVLRALTEQDLRKVLDRALEQQARSGTPIEAEEQALTLIARAADGDARRALNMLELSFDLAGATEPPQITEAIAAEVATGGLRRFDKQGEAFYDQISALHKSVRGSDPDAALYWFCRMLDGGCDPRYIARRVLRMASEDIGNADPRGLTHGTRGLRGLRAARHAGRRAGDRAGRRVPRVRRQEQRGVRGVRRSDGRREEARLARSAAASAQCADAADEGARLRQELSLRAQRAGRLCRGRNLFPRRHAAAASTTVRCPAAWKSRSPKRWKKEKRSRILPCSIPSCSVPIPPASRPTSRVAASRSTSHASARSRNRARNGRSARMSCATSAMCTPRASARRRRRVRTSRRC